MLHGALGGLSGAVLNGKDGAVSGASAAIIAETLADLVTPQVRDIAEKTAAHSMDEATFDQAMDDYLLQQKNVILLTTASIMAGLGQDVNIAITAADNALSNNFIPTILKTVSKVFVKETAKKASKEGVKKGVKEGVKARIKDAQLPTKGKIRFVPPKGYNPSKPLHKGPNHGYIDKFGNEWVKGPSRTAKESFEWDVQLSKVGKSKLDWLSRDSKHINVSLNGRVTHK